MPVVENLSPMLVIAVLTGLLSVYYLLALLTRIKRLKLLSALRRLTALAVFASITGMLSLLMVGTQGYHALTKEVPAATIKVSPTGEQSFHATMKFADGSQQSFSLKGDELLVDAYVLKWKPWTNILGLHTAYRLDRVSGRYKVIDDETRKQRSVFAINNSGGKGLAQWREDFSALSFLLDVEHGSASFVDAEDSKEFQLMVTTDGLLLRPLTATDSAE